MDHGTRSRPWGNNSLQRSSSFNACHSRQASHTSRLILSKIKDLYEGQTFNTAIEMDNALKEAQILSMPAIHYSQNSVAGTQYIELAKEIISNLDDSLQSAP